MSFRIELKAIVFPERLSEIVSWLLKNKGSSLYEDRLVNSVYYENKSFSMYHDSNEGVIPRKKIRYRCYESIFDLDEFLKKSNFEIKITSAEGRFKKIYRNEYKNNFSLLNYKDNQYGYCEPKLNVSYLRSYFKIGKFRLTIDKEITYRNIIFSKISPIFLKEKINIVELKYNKQYLDNTILENFPFKFIRFSKYCRGISFFNKI